MRQGPSSWTTTFRERRRQGPAGQADRPGVSVQQTPLLSLGAASRALQPPASRAELRVVGSRQPGRGQNWGGWVGAWEQGRGRACGGGPNSTSQLHSQESEEDPVSCGRDRGQGFKLCKHFGY